MRFRTAVLFCALLAYGEVPAKLPAGRLPERVVSPPAIPARPPEVPPPLRDIENRLQPFLESKLKGGSPNRPAPLSQTPRETDLLALARAWDSLSPAFKTLYEEATRIPDTFAMHVSPGGRFEVYYTVNDPVNGVDAVDTIGYGDSRDWRIRTHGNNGIPDYIDEAAWALDSSRSMLVDRFGFIPPLPHEDAGHTSGRYRVVICGFGSGDYGLTFPKGKAIGTTKGYSSYIEIRNEWRGNEWAKLGYGIHPENGIRVTLAHELFHAVQYAMTWNAPYDIDLDDFPLSWLEGTAVLMEELAFDAINDYIQYMEPFFGNPRMSFFGDAEGAAMYTNSLLVKYIFEKATGAPGIDFVRRMFFANYERITPFHSNLQTTSLAFGIPWVAILNRFSSASYFTGSRADTSRFLTDAGILGEWNVSPDTMAPSATLAKTVDPYATQSFAFRPNERHGDTLRFCLTCQNSHPGDMLPHPSWAASCLLKSAMRSDSAFALSIDNTGRAECRIDDWQSRRELLVFISNGHPSEKRTVSIHDPAPGFAVFPNPARLGSGRFMRFTGEDIKDIRIYSADGRLVCSTADRRAGAIQKYGGGFEWRLTNSRGETVVPGYYSAIVTPKDAHGAGKKSKLYKVLVYP